MAIGETLGQRLADQGLDVRRVQCVEPPGGASTYQGTKVLRCGVNVGATNKPVYCATIVSGRLITDRQIAQLRC